MCHFITATLPKDADLKSAEQIFKLHHLGFKEIENLSVFEHLEKGDIYILTTKGMCDCGTVLASNNPENHQSDEIQAQKYKDRTIEKLKAKGWSDTKIRRWQKETELNKEKETRVSEQAHENSLALVDDWINFIRDILNSKATKRVGILVHEYSGGLDNRIKILGKEKVELKNLTPNLLVEMREDVIYDFVA
jgi:hypothetical protein